jgi:hypothetical protein
MVAVRNVGQLDFPLTAQLEQQFVEPPSPDHFLDRGSKEIQGASLRTFPLEPGVEACEVLLETDGRPLNARIEIIQGPNSNKQVIDVNTGNGLDRPFYVTLNTPFEDTVVKISNTGPVEFPLTATVVPTYPRGIGGRGR